MTSFHINYIDTILGTFTIENSFFTSPRVASKWEITLKIKKWVHMSMEGCSVSANYIHLSHSVVKHMSRPSEAEIKRMKLQSEIKGWSIFLASR